MQKIAHLAKMPDTKRHLGPEDSFSPLLLLAEEDKLSAKSLVSFFLLFLVYFDMHDVKVTADGLRLDKRKSNEIRPLCELELKLSVVHVTVLY